MSAYVSLTRTACFAQETIRRVLCKAIGSGRNVEIRQLTLDYSRHRSKEHGCIDVRFSAGIVGFTGRHCPPSDRDDYDLEQPFVGAIRICNSNLDGDLVHSCWVEGWLEWTNPQTGEQDTVAFERSGNKVRLKFNKRLYPA
jgi:hypothetical protein